MKHSRYLSIVVNFDCLESWCVTSPRTVYPKAAKRSIPCAPLLSLNGNTVIIAAAELFDYN